MQFLLFDVSATLVFLLGYLTVLALQRRLTMAVSMASGRAPDTPRGAAAFARARQGQLPKGIRKERPAEPCCREWPRLSAPR